VGIEPIPKSAENARKTAGMQLAVPYGLSERSRVLCAE
jgi:hypothetical protein